ncbi:MAG: peptide-methionine (S)-S-oxide reductase MsrA [Opitutales bacterium]|nr:peptide-methionine (S)-S-oxide reductase MsrA [Opitutales bacterium]
MNFCRTFSLFLLGVILCSGISEQALFSEEPPMSDSANSEQAIFGGGCFWCMEAVYQRLDGVISAGPGFTGGHTVNPSYQEVCTGNTGHAEVIRIIYDPQKISYETLLEVFWQAHDPTTLNYQGADKGTQYRSAIFYTSDEQKAQAEASLKAAQGHFEDKIVTEITPLKAFYPAEDYHDNYFARNQEQSYCNFVILPKLKKLEAKQVIPTVNEEPQK